MANQVLTQARTEQITEMLAANPERAGKLLELTPEDALKEINGGLGYDFTLEEINEYGSLLKKAAMLDDDALSGVAGCVSRGIGEFASPDAVAAGALDGDMAEQMAKAVTVIYGVMPSLINWGILDSIIGTVRP